MRYGLSCEGRILRIMCGPSRHFDSVGSSATKEVLRKKFQKQNLVGPGAFYYKFGSWPVIKRGSEELLLILNKSQ